jgi:hypothetical protein
VLQNYKGYKSQIVLAPFYKGLEKLLNKDYGSAAKIFEQGTRIAVENQAIYLIGYGNYLRAVSLSRVSRESNSGEIARCKQEAISRFAALRIDFDISKVESM